MDHLHVRHIYHRANSEDPNTPNEDLEMTLVPTGNIPTEIKYDLESVRIPEGQRQAEPRQPYLIKPSPQARWFSGWRTGAYAAAFFAFCSLIINAVAAAWLHSHSGDGGPYSDTGIQVYKGSCGTVARLDTWVHLAINALSTILLAGSNYCMQCLLAPNRREIDKTHASGRYLDIGVPSLRNMKSVAAYKVVMWWLLAVSSIPLHLLYNSAFYSSQMTTNYDIWVVSPEFFSPDANVTYSWYGDTDQDFPVSTEQVRQSAMGDGTSNFERLDAPSCIEAYGEVFQHEFRSLVIVSKNTSLTIVPNNTNFVIPDGPLYGNPVSDPQGSHTSVLYRLLNAFQGNADIDKGVEQSEWVCEGDISTWTEVNDKKTINDIVPCDSYLNRVKEHANIWRPLGFVFDYCLAERIQQQCTFTGIVPILDAVIACNVVKLLLMLMVAILLTDSPCITIGDAAESFLQYPDKYSKGLCLFDRFDCKKSESLSLHQRHSEALWQNKDGGKLKRAKITIMVWNQAAFWRWIITMTFFLLASIAVAALLGKAVNFTKGRNTLLGLGFGKIQAVTTITGWSVKTITESILVANLPQLILSFLYLNLNGLLTSMWAAREWSKFATERKYLRVSTRKGAQRSTHFLQLPYKIAIPLMVVSGLLHWILSQSIFLAVVASYNELGNLINPLAVVSCGISPLPMVFALVLGVLLVVGTYLIGIRKYDPSMPLAGSCSVAISAACHRPEWDIAAHLAPVKWGVVPGSEDEHGVGHCCFTSGEVEAVESGKLYAGAGEGKRRSS